MTMEAMNRRMREEVVEIPYQIGNLFFIESIELVNFDHFIEAGGNLRFIQQYNGTDYDPDADGI